MNRNLLKASLLLSAILLPGLCHAQLSKNENKFLGNITTYGQVNPGQGGEYASLWNEITPENETKWESIEGTRDVYNFGGADRSYNYAKSHNFPFKFHTFVWGGQYPSWMNSLSKEEQYEEIVEWFDAVKQHYPDLKMIDVVNEAITGHNPAPWKAALGGDGSTGYDWIIKAFELAHERWPEAILIYNDYNAISWQRKEFINLVGTLIDAGAPIDAYGCQGHSLDHMTAAEFKSAVDEIQNALRIPMYLTEYDVEKENDQEQKAIYETQFKYVWEQPYVAGVTIWGYIYGATWRDGTGLIKNGQDRAAMKWLREYMQTTEAKTAKSPFRKGYIKDASVYVQPSSIRPSVDKPMTITVRAKMRASSGKTIDSVLVYMGDELLGKLTEAPYVIDYTPDKVAKMEIKAVVYDNDGISYTRYSHINVAGPRYPFKGEPTPIPGTIKAVDYDKGGEGVAYHYSGTKEGDYSSYRPDGGESIVRGNGSAVLGYTNSGEWWEYTVNVAEAGIYTYSATVSSGTTNSGFTLSVNKDGKLTDFATVKVPQTGNNDWSVYTTVSARTTVALEAGEQIIRLTIDGSSCNIDKIVLKRVDLNNVKLDLSVDPATPVQGDAVKISAAVTNPDKINIKSVDFYLDEKKVAAIKAEPYAYTYSNAVSGQHNVRAVAVGEDGSESDYVQTSFSVLRKRAPYRNVSIPGTFEAENFDIQGEGYSFHDSDDTDEGGTGYRSDNEGLDISSRTGGYCVGYTIADEWMEYTVNVTEGGSYEYIATVSSGLSNSGFRIALKKENKYVTLANVSVPQTGDNNWDTYKSIKGNCLVDIPSGQQVIRITITGSYCNIDKIQLKLKTPTDIELPDDDTAATYNVFSLTGARISQISVPSGTSQDAGKMIYQQTGKTGVFIIQNVATGKSERCVSVE